MKTDDHDQRFIDFYQRMGSGTGLDPLFLRLFAILYIEPEPVSLDELAERTGYSLASISNKAKQLEAFSLVRRKAKPGTRKVYLYAEKDFKKVMKEQLLKKEQNQIKVAKDELPEMIKEYKAKAKNADDKRKVKILEDYHKQILQFEECIKHMLKELDNI